MNVSSAVELVNRLVFLPEWQITAEDHQNRFEGSIVVNFVYQARRSERELAPQYLEFVPGGAKASFPLVVSDLDEIGLYRAVLGLIMEVWEHESREFLRVAPTNWAPFHPHRADGMARFGQPERDLHFGLS